MVGCDNRPPGRSISFCLTPLVTLCRCPTTGRGRNRPFAHLPTCDTSERSAYLGLFCPSKVAHVSPRAGIRSSLIPWRRRLDRSTTASPDATHQCPFARLCSPGLGRKPDLSAPALYRGARSTRSALAGFGLWFVREAAEVADEAHEVKQSTSLGGRTALTLDRDWTSSQLEPKLNRFQGLIQSAIHRETLTRAR